jgi:hypothetical protein
MQKFDHKSYIKSASWEELADMIINLEMEKSKITKNRIRKYEDIIRLYEDAKQEKINSQVTVARFNQTININAYGECQYDIGLDEEDF